MASDPISVTGDGRAFHGESEAMSIQIVGEPPAGSKQGPAQLFESIDALRSSGQTGYVLLSEMGRTAPVYTYATVKVVNYGAATVTTKGIGGDDGIFFETTLGGMNPHWAKSDAAEYRMVTHSITRAQEIIRRLPAQELMIDRCVVAMHDWDHNYQHFIVESLPRIFVAVTAGLDRIGPIVVLDSSHVREIVTALFPNVNFLFCPPDGKLFVRNATWSVSPTCFNFGDTSDVLFRTLAALRQRFASTIVVDQASRSPTFFTRLRRSENAGAARVMANEDNFVQAFREAGGQINYFDTRSLAEKSRHLDAASTVITPIGANVMNLLLIRQPTKVILIDHPFFSLSDWFIRLFANAGVPVDVSICRDVELTTLNEADRGNSPYSVNVDALVAMIRDATETTSPPCETSPEGRLQLPLDPTSTTNASTPSI